jgi:hypothetical protein
MKANSQTRRPASELSAILARVSRVGVPKSREWLLLPLQLRPEQEIEILQEVHKLLPGAGAGSSRKPLPAKAPRPRSSGRSDNSIHRFRVPMLRLAALLESQAGVLGAGTASAASTAAGRGLSSSSDSKTVRSNHNSK